MMTAAEKRRRRRRVLPGFPLPSDYFGSNNAVDMWFSGDHVLCPLCGKSFKALSMHISAIHEMTPNEFRELYGFRLRNTLSSSLTVQLKAKASLTNGGMLQWSSAQRSEYQSLAIIAERHKRSRLSLESSHKNRLAATEAALQILVDIQCSDCGVIYRGLNTKTCPKCRNKMTPEVKEKLAQWIRDNPARFREWAAAAQRNFHGNPEPLERYRKKYPTARPGKKT